MEEFYTSVMELSRVLILDSKQLVSMVSEAEESIQEEKVYDFADQTEAHVEQLVQLVTNKITELVSSASSPQALTNKANFEFVIDATKSVRSSVLDLADGARAVVSNPFDFLTKQRLRDGIGSVAISIKNIIASADSLKTSFNTASDGNVTQEKAEATSEEEADITNDAKSAIKALARLRQCILLSEDRDVFLDAVRDVSKSVTELLVTARNLKLKEIADRLKEATVNLISAAKMISKNPGDEVFASQLEMATAKVAESIKAVVYAVRERTNKGKGISHSKSIEGITQAINAITAPPENNNNIRANDARVPTSPISSPPPKYSQPESKADREKALKTINDKKKEIEEAEKKKRNDEVKAEKKEPVKVTSNEVPTASPFKEDPHHKKDHHKKDDHKKEDPHHKKEDPHHKKEDIKKDDHKKEDHKKEDPHQKKDEHVAQSPKKEEGEFKKGVKEAPKVPEKDKKPFLGFGKKKEEPKKTAAEKDISDVIIELLGDKVTSGFRKDWEAQSTDSAKSLKQKILSEIQKTNVTSEQKPAAAEEPKNKEETKPDLKKSEETAIEKTKQVKIAAFKSQISKRDLFRREPTGGADEISIANQSFALAASFGESVIIFISRTSESVLDPSLDMKHLTETVQEMVENLKKSVAIANHAAKLQKLVLQERIMTSASKAVDSTPLRGKLISNIVEAASGSQAARIVEGSLQQKIFNDADAVRALAIQIVANLNAMGIHLSNSRILTLLYNIGAVISSFIQAKERLMDGVETIRYISSIKSKNTLMASNSVGEEVTILDIDEDDINIWDEPASSPPVAKTGDYSAGTLNRLVEFLTNEEALDNKFLKTFITTYQSFTSPSKLLEKLIQRYEPPGKGRDNKKAIQVRVAVVLKYWVENQSKDFDESLIQKVFDFYNKLSNDGHVDLSRLLRKEFEKKVAERSAKIKYLLTAPPADVIVVEANRLTPVSYFMVTNDSEIARQLTLIDYKLFESVEPSELLNQAWSKESLKHRSPNILSMISRANRVSFFVASIILFQDTVQERSKFYQKFINIAEELRKHNNFHTLMGIIAGINQSSITRMKKTFEEVPIAIRELAKNLEKLMNPASSYKNYRQTLNKSSLPSLPYIGTYLSDLTFMEDGNPDMTKNNLINFQKRELIYGVIEEVARYQQTPYLFPIVEPINTILLDLPSCSEGDLYDLSLKYEPRESGKDTMKASSTASRSLLSKKSILANF